jgi:hypothetical protein
MAKLKPNGVLRKDYLFCDVEASSLWTTAPFGVDVPSYPVEFGFANDGLESWAVLVRPHETWLEGGWDTTSEGIHGISRERLFDEGLPVGEVVERIDAAVRGLRGVFSDCMDWDNYWLRTLYKAVGRKAPFAMHDENQAVGDHLRLTEETVGGVLKRVAQAQELAEQRWPHPHRAALDAVRMAAGFRLAVDDAFFAVVAEAQAYGPSGAAEA